MEATVDIGADTVAVVAGTQAVAQAVGDNGAQLEEGEETVAIQSKASFISKCFSQQVTSSCFRALSICLEKPVRIFHHKEQYNFS